MKLYPVEKSIRILNKWARRDDTLPIPGDVYGHLLGWVIRLSPAIGRKHGRDMRPNDETGRRDSQFLHKAARAVEGE